MGSAATERARKRSKSREAGSAHWMSSRMRTSGWRAASAAKKASASRKNSAWLAAALAAAGGRRVTLRRATDAHPFERGERLGKPQRFGLIQHLDPLAPLQPVGDVLRERA